MILVVFFGRFGMQGLASDAAMYAGLSRSILDQGHWWSPRGLTMFPVFFEHPPYSFQWGALVLRVLGQSDGAARAIGAIPGAIALIVLVTWVWRRHSWDLSFWTLIFLLTFGHYTKYSATVMLEAPLSLGAILFAIGTFEFFFRRETRRRWLMLACLGALISTSAKGVVGFVFCAALTPFVVGFANKDAAYLGRRGAWFLACGLAAAIPLLLWGLMTSTLVGDGTSLLSRYFNEQVFRSYATNRGHPELYAKSWSWWSYPAVILKHGWPWWWTVPLGAVWISRRSALQEAFLKLWSKLAVAFFVVLLVVFSTSHVRLPHYLHPTYMLVAPLGAFAMLVLTRRYICVSSAVGRRLRWCALGMLFFAMAFTFRGASPTANRGQAFALLAQQINHLPKDCEVYLSQDEAELYQSETYFLWYLKGRRFHRIPVAEFHNSRRKILQKRVWWSPRTGDLQIHPSCGV